MPTTLFDRLAAGWRALWVPRAAREVEDRGLRAALAGMPVPPPGPDPLAGLGEARRQLDDTEARLRFLEARRRLYERAGRGSPARRVRSGRAPVRARGPPFTLLHPSGALPMKRITTQVREFLREEDGAAVAEYGLLLAIVAVGMITVLTAFRNELTNWWRNLQGQLVATPSAPPAP